jgi:hypothetical protein
MQTKSTKIYASVLGLAAAAFAVDRWVIGQPASAEASPPAAAFLLAPSVQGPAAAADGSPTPAAQARRWRRTRGRRYRSKPCRPASNWPPPRKARRPTPSADAFRPARAWAGEKPIPQPQAQAAPAAPARDPVAEFRQRHKLNAVIRRGGGGAAVIDGQMLSPGQALDGSSWSASAPARPRSNRTAAASKWCWRRVRSDARGCCSANGICPCGTGTGAGTRPGASKATC